MDQRIDPEIQATCGACGYPHSEAVSCGEAGDLRRSPALSRHCPQPPPPPTSTVPYPPKPVLPVPQAQPTVSPFHVLGYKCLADVLVAAYDQAAQGKGAERHADNRPFDDQPMQHIARRRGIGFILGQADKKSEEAQGMLGRGERDKATHELLGAIVYLAGAIIHIENSQGDTK